MMRVNPAIVNFIHHIFTNRMREPLDLDKKIYKFVHGTISSLFEQKQNKAHFNPSPVKGAVVLRTGTTGTLSPTARTAEMALHGVPKKLSEREVITKIFGGEQLDPSQRVSRDKAQQELASTFGDKLVGNVFERYGLDKSTDIDMHELSVLIIGIKANMTIEGLEKAYINRETLGITFPGNKMFNELNPKELYDFLSVVRETNNKNKIIHYSENRFRKVPKRYNKKLLKADLYLLRKISISKDYGSVNKSLEKKYDILRGPEFMAREIANALAKVTPVVFVDGVLFPLFDPRVGENPVLMEAHNNVSHRGLHACNLIPAAPANHSKVEQEKLRGATVFRGTKASDKYSIHRDIDFSHKIRTRSIQRGPGEGQFAQHQDELMNNIYRDINLYRKKLSDANIADKAPPIGWDITGHSVVGGFGWTVFAVFK